jgi:hypothetical protein
LLRTDSPLQQYPFCHDNIMCLTVLIQGCDLNSVA